MFSGESRSWRLSLAVVGVLGVAGAGGIAWYLAARPSVGIAESVRLAPRLTFESSGYSVVSSAALPWSPTASLAEVKTCWQGVADRVIARLDQELQAAGGNGNEEISLLSTKAGCHMYAGHPEQAYAVLAEARAIAERDGGAARETYLSSLMFFQGVAALRRGENENCILCRGESSCILPINPAAVHQNPEGSRLAIRHFTEYLEHFPEDLEVRWLLNLAHMTLGEHPDKVDPRYLIRLDRFRDSEFDIGRFRDIGYLVGVNRFSQAGGAIMDDFDNDGLLDLVTTTCDALQPLSLYRNRGDGRFEDVAEAAGLAGQFGGLNCVQTDYNNDGLMDFFILRGAWLTQPVRPSLLRNDGNMKFTDVTEEAGLLFPVNSNSASWADYDNDGWLDLFVCSERGRNLLFRNLRDGTFVEAGEDAGVTADGQSWAKACSWFDYDNDDFPDLFIAFYSGAGQLYHNDRNGKFTNVTLSLGVNGPVSGFSCWAWDYDNDGWLDLFATCYERSLEQVVKGLIGEPHTMRSNKLFRNLQGSGFRDVTRDAGLDMVFATMGCNYGDFDNDGYLDMYLGTGDPDLTTLIPNRMFKNVAGRRFAEITGSAGVGQLQKGHGVACGDWDRDGNLDLFVQMGGVTDGDQYHDILFQNPGHAATWIAVKLIGQKSNRAALGARIKVVTAGDHSLTVHRHVSPGSSFGGNPLEQTIGLGDAERIAELTVHWPTSRTKQTYRDLPVNQFLEITELETDYRRVDRPRAPVPTADPADRGMTISPVHGK